MTKQPVWQRRFEYCGKMWRSGSDGTSRCLDVCSETLGEYFSIPVEAWRIWIALYEDAGDGRYEVTSVKDSYECLSLEFAGLSNEECMASVNKLLKKYMGRTFYLQVEYE